MQLSSKSAKRAPLLAILAVAASLLVPVSANAAMGGANPGVGTLTPNLRSANVTAFDSVAGRTTIQVCWDKGIASLPNPNRIRLGTYRQSSYNGGSPNDRPADSASRVGTNCADAVYSSVILDPTQYTYVHTEYSAVVSAAQAKPNNDDSTALILPGALGTHTGTAGHNASPSLIGCTVDNGLATVSYVFDKNLAAAFNNNTGITPAGSGTKFRLERFDGSSINSNGSGDSTAVTFSANVVKAKFPGGSTLAGVRCVVAKQSVLGLSEPTTTNPTVQVAAVPGNSGNVDNAPDLLSAAVAADGSYIDYVFDETISLGAPTAFHFIYSDGSFVTGSSVNEFRIVSGNTVRWFPGNPNVSPAVPAPGDTTETNEFLVNAAVDPGAVSGDSNDNFEGFTPLGDNQGAFASGFTTGPEALRATFNNTTGEVSVLMDQRFTFGLAFNFVLLDDTGAVIGGGDPILTSGAGGSASQRTAVFRFTTAQLGGARSVQLLFGEGCAVISNLDYCNVDQILSPTPTAAVLSKKSHARWHKASSKHVAKKFRSKRRHAKRLNK